MKHIDSSMSVLTTETNIRKGYIKPSEPSIKVNLVKKKECLNERYN